MSLSDYQPWTVADFFSWQQDQEERYELVGGFPKLQPFRRMGHNLIVTNVLTSLVDLLRKTPFRPFSANIGVETFPGQIRRPDAGVDCGAFDPDGYLAAEPVVVFEVLSPSTRDFDRLRKVEEYKGVSSMRHIVVVEPEGPQVLVWSREEQGEWSVEIITGLEASLPLPALAIDLPMAELYDRLDVSD
ncbi:Uma2 family endonuclease [Jiella marina]|uniref:Uma2 family endonuclease n=1 Tax=Jiella sp. LLJ827 TaxID=2917712 RepID=UPI002100CDE3|nr:Uma2 family endonuclease [Jiella sp. LLJ827]MCQ0986995.1 Uma2 family endonuclease [Jiella sp. LLJ827]